MATKGIVEPATQEYHVLAFLALADGVASEGQQKAAMEWLLKEACRFTSNTYAEVLAAGGDERDVIFALGRQHVAHLIRAMAFPETLKKARELTAALHPDGPPPSNQPLRRARTKRQQK